MDCYNSEENLIAIVKGDDTNVFGQHLLTLNLRSEYLDLSDLKATFTLGGYERNFYDLSSGQIVIDYSSVETSTFPVGINYGDLKIISKTGKISTIENRLAFNVITEVHGNAIATKPYEVTINVEQGGQNILDIDVITSLIQIDVGNTVTLPPGSEAYVINRGDNNHAIFDFGIPEGDGIKKIEKTSTSGLVDTYTVTSETGKTTTFEVTNGSSIQSIEKTGTDVLVDTYTVTLTNGNTTTFEVTNGRAISSIAKTGTSGLVDTYTITYNDNTTSTFEITNGKDATINGVNALTLNTAYGLSISQSGDTATISGKDITDVVDGISALIPSQATESNQLADKAFVNSSIATNTANFIGTFNSVADLEAYSGTLTNNDYAFVVGTDSAGNTKYDRYKYTTATTPASWEYEYTLNNSSFTSNQWAAINSGATTTNIGQITTNKNAIGTLANLTTTEKSSLVGAINELDNDKQENITGGASTITNSNLTANRALISNAQGKVAVSPTTSTELGYLSGTTSAVQTQLNGKASTSLDNLSSDGQMIIDSQNGTISNCILDIPQDIKLELDDGTLTLKSGSIITIPDGSQFQLTSNKTFSSVSGDYKGLIFVGIYGTINGVINTTQFSSGPTLPADGSTFIRFFNTSDSKFYRWDDTAWVVWNVALPIGTCTVTSDVITSIDQIFNGFGYMGQTKFMLPGVKVLTAKGKNDDGTLNSGLFENNALVFVTQGGTYNRRIFLNNGNFQITANNWIYNEEKNIFYDQNNNPLTGGVCYIGDCFTTSDVVTKFTVRDPVRLATTEMTDNLQSQVSANATAITTKQDTLVSGTNIKTINSTTLLGSGNFTLADQSLSNLNSTGQMVVDSQNGTISNCILDIPQDIKLELNNGTLTLKSGSVITYPNGTQYQMTSDISDSFTGTGKYVLMVTTDHAHLRVAQIANTCSGPTDSLSGGHVWFDTENLVINQYNNQGTLAGTRTLPIALITLDSNIPTSIDQVFNGAGYIGHHFFVLPGVVALEGNGFNADGTLKTIKRTATELAILEMREPSTVGGIRASGMLTSASSNMRCLDCGEVETRSDIDTTYGFLYYYIKDENKIYYYANNSWHSWHDVVFVRYIYDGTSVTYFEIRQPVRTATVEMLDKKANDLTTITGYNASATQTLKNINGVLTWVTDS